MGVSLTTITISGSASAREMAVRTSVKLLPLLGAHPSWDVEERDSFTSVPSQSCLQGSFGGAHLPPAGIVFDRISSIVPGYGEWADGRGLSKDSSLPLNFEMRFGGRSIFF